MQVSTLKDLETTLRSDLEALTSDLNCRVYCPPLPEELLYGVEADVVLYQVGGEAVSPVSDRYDISIDVYAEDPDTAKEYVNAVRALVAQLPLLETSYQYSNADCGIPYDNYDPRAPQLFRKTFRAYVIMPATR